MKLILTFLVILTVHRTTEVYGVPVSHKTESIQRLSSEIDDFISLIPKQNVQKILYDYVIDDENFRNSLIYVLSDEFQSEVTKIASDPEVQDFLKYLEDSGVNLYNFIDKINSILKFEESHQYTVPRFTTLLGGLFGFIEDLKTALPLENKEKLNNSRYFIRLIETFKSEEFKQRVKKLLLNSNVQNFIRHAETRKIDVQTIFNFFSSILEFEFSTKSVLLNTRNLKHDLQDFLRLIPREKIQDLFFEYLADDEDFGEALDYVMSDEFKSLVTEVEGMAEVEHLLHFLQDSGLDAYGFVNKINDILGIEKIRPPIFFRSSRISGGLPGFINDVKALLPVDEIEKLYKDKLTSSKDFAKLIERLESKEFQGLVDKLMANSKLQDLMKRAEAKGVDVQAILDFLSSVLGLKFPPRSDTIFDTMNLEDDLQDFLRLIPAEIFENILYEYTTNDEDFRDTINYLVSNEFKSLLIDIVEMIEDDHILQFLQDSGLNDYGFITKINDIFGIEKNENTIDSSMTFESRKITGGLPGFFKDLKKNLPIEKIEKLYKDKLTSSKDFATLIERLESKEFQGFVDKLMANSKLQNLMKRAEAKGVDVQAILDFFSSLLGLKFPSRSAMFLTRNLKDDLQDFLHLIPKEKIEDLFFEYLADDEDFGEALDYVMSDEFKSLVTEVEGMAEVDHLLHFLQDSGLNAYGFINKINDILGIEKIVPPKLLKFTRISGGLPGFIKDVKALLPVDEIEKMYKDKLTSSKDFATLIDRLKSKEFQGLVDKLMANSKLQDLMKRAEAKGVDVQAILDFLSSVLGLKFPSRPGFFKEEEEEVIDILHVIWSKIPMDGILDTMIDYLIEDDDFKKVVKYMMNSEFKDILMDIEELSEIKLLLKYLDENDIDVYTWMNNFHDLIGLEKTLPSENNYKKITGGIPGLIQDIRSQLPIEELHNYYDEKLKTSNNFKEFINRLTKKELQDAVDALHNHKGFNVLLNKLEALGVDLDEIIEVINAILGIKFPDRPF